MRNSFNGTHHDRIIVLISVFDGRRGFRENPQRNGQVTEGISVDTDILTANHLVHFETDGTDDHSSGGGNSGNNLSGNELNLVSRNFFDGVVSGSQVGNSGDEVNVEVAIIVLFEFNGVDLSSSRDLGSYAGKTR